MRKKTIEESFDFYLSTLEKIGLFLNNYTDEQLEYQLYEGFGSEYQGSLSIALLDKLFDNGLITEEIVSESKKLQSSLLGLQGSELWNSSDLKKHNSWHEALKLADTLKEMISDYWSPDELKSLRQSDK